MIELKQRNLIDEINVLSSEHSKQLNQQTINGSNLKQLFLQKTNELNTIQNGSDVSVKDILNVCIIKYYEFAQFAAVSRL